MANVLVVDDGSASGHCCRNPDRRGHRRTAENAAEARACRERLRPDLVLLDIWMPDVDGITLLKEWGASALLTMPVIMMSGHGTIDTAVEATKFGAMAFLEKPITLQKLLRAVEQGLAKPAPHRPMRATRSGSSPRRRRHRQRHRRRASRRLRSGRCPSRASRSIGRCAKRDAFEKSYFEFHLARENGSMTRVAEKTGLERTHLYRKLKQLGVDLTRNKRG
jgi:DNA-binding NtrC family response regulator